MEQRNVKRPKPCREAKMKKNSKHRRHQTNKKERTTDSQQAQVRKAGRQPQHVSSPSATRGLSNKAPPTSEQPRAREQKQHSWDREISNKERGSGLGIIVIRLAVARDIGCRDAVSIVIDMMESLQDGTKERFFYKAKYKCGICHNAASGRGRSRRPNPIVRIAR